jgi:hypothetical protein
LGDLVKEVEKLVEELGVQSTNELRGEMSMEKYVEPTAFERTSYIKLLQSYGRI